MQTIQDFYFCHLKLTNSLLEYLEIFLKINIQTYQIIISISPYFSHASLRQN